MKNNHLQKIYSVLDSLTQTELDQYIQDRKINVKYNQLFSKLNKISRPDTHYLKWVHKINETSNINNVLNSYLFLGEAWIIAFVLECFYDEKYKVKDIQSYMKALIKDNPELKDMVYDLMKDF